MNVLHLKGAGAISRRPQELSISQFQEMSRYSVVAQFRYCHEGPTMTFKRYALLAVLLATPAYADWAPDVYNAEYDACVPPCDNNNPASHDKCVSYCHCVMDSLQSQFPDHEQINSDYANKVPASMAAIQTIANTCNQKFFGAPAREVK
jgi:hypothetical protein